MWNFREVFYGFHFIFQTYHLDLLGFLFKTGVWGFGKAPAFVPPLVFSFLVIILYGDLFSFQTRVTIGRGSYLCGVNGKDVTSIFHSFLGTYLLGLHHLELDFVCHFWGFLVFSSYNFFSFILYSFLSSLHSLEGLSWPCSSPFCMVSYVFGGQILFKDFIFPYVPSSLFLMVCLGWISPCKALIRGESFFMKVIFHLVTMSQMMYSYYFSLLYYFLFKWEHLSRWRHILWRWIEVSKRSSMVVGSLSLHIVVLWWFQFQLDSIHWLTIPSYSYLEWISSLCGFQVFQFSFMMILVLSIQFWRFCVSFCSFQSLSFFTLFPSLFLFHFPPFLGAKGALWFGVWGSHLNPSIFKI